ncbi:hypothetical protein FOZG_15899 [Fusarium oxysporum Fo47]|uniref:Uncharacterized protein n=1 Tax=Fusarium oxysporum Fo47 TaxID=660027 RepID=W9JL85_FUSOX|nr:hypothetical protein FOZG_15899 [Fusarium oxysporum Fo47]
MDVSSCEIGGWGDLNSSQLDSENIVSSPRIGKPLKPRPRRDCRQRAASSSSLPLGDRFATPPHRAGHQVLQAITPSRVQRHRPAVSGHQQAESFEHYISSTRNLTRRNPSNDEITMVGFANGLLPRRGRALAPTSGSGLGESPPLPRRQDMEQLEQRVEDLQIAPRGKTDGPQPSELLHYMASARSAWSISQIDTSKRPCEEPGIIWP